MKLKQNEAFPGPKVGLQAPGEEGLCPISESSLAMLIFPGTQRGRQVGKSLPSRQVEKLRLRVVKLEPGSHS